MYSFTSLGLLLVGALILRQVASLISSWRFSYANGCMPPPTKRSWEPIFGVGIAVEFWQAVRAGNRIETAIKDARGLNGTFQFSLFGRHSIMTADSVNAHAILVTNIGKDWLCQSHLALNKGAGR